MGFADGWVTHPTRLAFSCLPFWQIPLVRIKQWVKRSWIKRADAIVFETEVAKDGLVRQMPCLEGRCHVIPNAVPAALWGGGYERCQRSSEIVNVLVIGLGYPHKRIDVVVNLYDAWHEIGRNRDIRIHVTLDEKSPVLRYIQGEMRRRCADDVIVNHGVLPVRQCRELYLSADAVFHPSVLETFSATYLEAMHYNVPIICWDLPFAREICGDYGVYCGVYDFKCVAIHLQKLCDSKEFDAARRRRAIKCLSKFPDPESKFKAQMKIIGTFREKGKLFKAPVNL